MTLVPSFIDMLQALAPVMTAPSFNSFLTILAGWFFTRHHTVTGMIQAANAVDTKHHSSFHRLFANAAWSLDELGLSDTSLVVQEETVFTMSGRTAQAYTISLLYGNAREKLACHKDLAVMSAYGADLAEKFGIKFNISM